MQGKQPKSRFKMATAMLVAFASYGSTPAIAHHSFAMFDREHTRVLDGAVRAIAWENPHGTIWILVPQASGDPQLWTIQTGPVAELIAAGFKKADFNQGDKIRLTINPLKDGRTGGTLVAATLADGRTIKQELGTP